MNEINCGHIITTKFNQNEITGNTNTQNLLLLVDIYTFSAYKHILGYTNKKSFKKRNKNIFKEIRYH